MSAAVSGRARDGDGNVRKDTWGLWNSGGCLFLGLFIRVCRIMFCTIHLWSRSFFYTYILLKVETHMNKIHICEMIHIAAFLLKKLFEHYQYLFPTFICIF